MIGNINSIYPLRSVISFSVPSPMLTTSAHSPLASLRARDRSPVLTTSPNPGVSCLAPKNVKQLFHHLLQPLSQPLRLMVFIPVSNSARCLGAWWTPNLSCSTWIATNIKKPEEPSSPVAVGCSMGLLGILATFLLHYRTRASPNVLVWFYLSYM